MRRTYALKRLLEHGPLTTAEIVEIMGGERKKAVNALRALMLTRCVVKLNGAWKLSQSYQKYAPK